MAANCVFCKIVAGDEPADVVDRGDDWAAFRPHRPHTPGHVLFVPRRHVRDATEHPPTTALTVSAAAAYAAWLDQPANIVTSIGAEATQTVMHLHIHVVPRGPEDGLRPSWPWRVRLSQGLGASEIFPEEGYEELAAQLASPRGVAPRKRSVYKDPGTH